MIICDIDGCIFNNFHRSNLIPTDKSLAKNWEEFNKAHKNDMPVMPMINFVSKLIEVTNEPLIFLTSRSLTCKIETLNQLWPHFGHINNTSIYMRPAGDDSSPVEFKRKFIKGLPHSFGVNSMIIDDDPDIIDMARSYFPKLNTFLTKSFDCTLFGRG